MPKTTSRKSGASASSPRKSYSSEDPTFYDLLDVSPKASPAEIKKAYRQRALQTHPDKQPTAETRAQATASFTAVQKAYEVLSDPERRQQYDANGYRHDENMDSRSFRNAYEFYRSFYPKITPQDIDDFSVRYRHSKEEKADLLGVFTRNSGDISNLLEWIPVSEPGDVDRFIAFFHELFETGELKQTEVFDKAVPKLKANARKIQKEINRSKAPKETTTEPMHKNDMDSLRLAILGKRRDREVAQSKFIADLEVRYAIAKRRK